MLKLLNPELAKPITYQALKYFVEHENDLELI
jgi:hypothetical protein